eukprot:8442560-Heterocapsa_arctica.AAC.1
METATHPRPGPMGHMDTWTQGHLPGAHLPTTPQIRDPKAERAPCPQRTFSRERKRPPALDQPSAVQIPLP